MTHDQSHQTIWRDSIGSSIHHKATDIESKMLHNKVMSTENLPQLVQPMIITPSNRNKPLQSSNDLSNTRSRKLLEYRAPPTVADKRAIQQAQYMPDKMVNFVNQNTKKQAKRISTEKVDQDNDGSEGFLSIQPKQ